MGKALRIKTDTNKKMQLPELIHSIRVAEMSLKHVIEYSIDVSHKEVYISGILHDIGKALVDEEILNKPGKHTQLENYYMKKHSEYGALIGLEIDLDKNVIKNILAHHESYDGSGYPKGIKGDEIPIIARLLRIYDVLDALTSDRPYRRAKTIDEAIEIMEKEKKNFDPVLYDQFKKLLESHDFKTFIYKK